MKPAFSVCVYCGSRPGYNPVFAHTARAVGRWIGLHQGQLIYGGGNAGLMGQMAQSALEHGASVIGIIPKALLEREWALEGCTELHVVDTMHERKRMMAERADAFMALPGGIGTLEEFFEVWTWRQLGYHDKPVGLLNTANFFDGLIEFMKFTVEQQFLGEAQMDLIRVGEDPGELLSLIVQDAGLSPRAKIEQI